MGKLAELYKKSKYEKAVTLELPVSGVKLKLRRPTYDDIRFIRTQIDIIREESDFDARFVAILLKRLCDDFENEKDNELVKDVKLMEEPDRVAISQLYNELTGLTQERLNAILAENFLKTPKTKQI